MAPPFDVLTGIHHILLRPLNSDELKSVLKRALTRCEKRPVVPDRRNVTVVGFIGSCSGVGATSLAVQGACALSHLKSFNWLRRRNTMPRGIRIGPTTTLSSTKLPYWK